MRVNRLSTELDSLLEGDFEKTFQNRSVSSPAPVTIASPSGDIACSIKQSIVVVDVPHIYPPVIGQRQTLTIR